MSWISGISFDPIIKNAIFASLGFIQLILSAIWIFWPIHLIRISRFPKNIEFYPFFNMGDNVWTIITRLGILVGFLYWVSYIIFYEYS